MATRAVSSPGRWPTKCLLTGHHKYLSKGVGACDLHFFTGVIIKLYERTTEGLLNKEVTWHGRN